MQFKLVSGDSNELVKQFFYLAWKACGGPLGMGYLQDNPTADADRVFDNVKSAGDYPGYFTPCTNGKYYADYVFGRMMKVGLNVLDNGVITTSDYTPTPDYQAWCHEFPTDAALLEAAAVAANCELQHIE
jgi:hypothetical protein